MCIIARAAQTKETELRKTALRVAVLTQKSCRVGLIACSSLVTTSPSSQNGEFVIMDFQ